MTYCRKCGAHLEENARFCHKCGTEVVAFTPSPAPSATTFQTTFETTQIFPAPSMPPAEPVKPSTKKTFSTTAVIALAVVIIVFIVVSVLVLATFYSNVNQTNTSNPNVNELSFHIQNGQTQANSAVNTKPKAGTPHLSISDGRFNLMSPLA